MYHKDTTPFLRIAMVILLACNFGCRLFATAHPVIECQWGWTKSNLNVGKHNHTCAQIEPVVRSLTEWTCNWCGRGDRQVPSVWACFAWDKDLQVVTGDQLPGGSYECPVGMYYHNGQKIPWSCFRYDGSPFNRVVELRCKAKHLTQQCPLSACTRVEDLPRHTS